MRYFIILAMSLVLMGAGCQLQSPQPITSDVNEKETTTKQPSIQPEVPDVNDQKDEVEDDANKVNESEDANEDDKAWFEKTTDEEMQQIKDNQKDKEYPTNDRGREIITPISVLSNLDANRIDIMLVSTEDPSPVQSEGPAFRFGCDEYLYPTTVTLDEEKSQSDLATAIVQLLTYKPNVDSTLINTVRGKGLILTNVKYENGMRVVELEGKDINTGETCDDVRIKAQLEETVGMYIENFEIRLNGSASEWKCLFDETETCN